MSAAMMCQWSSSMPFTSVNEPISFVLDRAPLFAAMFDEGGRDRSLAVDDPRNRCAPTCWEEEADEEEDDDDELDFLDDEEDEELDDEEDDLLADDDFAADDDELEEDEEDVDEEV